MASLIVKVFPGIVRSREGRDVDLFCTPPPEIPIFAANSSVQATVSTRLPRKVFNVTIGSRHSLPIRRRASRRSEAAEAGYRFRESPHPHEALAATTSAKTTPLVNQLWWKWAALLAAGTLFALGILTWLRWPVPPVRVLDSTQVTNDGRLKVSPALTVSPTTGGAAAEWSDHHRRSGFE